MATIMDQSFAKSMCDFSFGMLFMAQLICTAAMYYKGQRNDLQKMMFRFMLYLVLIKVTALGYLKFCKKQGQCIFIP